MRKLGTRVVKVADLQVTAFVRKALDEGHAMALAELIETGVEMSDRIEITDMGIPNSIVNGRHRKEAYELAKVKEVTVDVLSFESQTELLAYAYRANTGGSLPPTREDTELVVMTLVDSGEKPKRIGELLGLPPSLIRRYTADLQTKRARTKLAQAAAAVTDGGLTVAKAADQFEVDLEQLKELLSGRRKKQRRNGIGDLQ
ncbi:MAG: hypothetical protein Q8P82_00320, partial [bacterium]|nr:hypothetical protein [bacterium]